MSLVNNIIVTVGDIRHHCYQSYQLSRSAYEGILRSLEKPWETRGKVLGGNKVQYYNLHTNKGNSKHLKWLINGLP